MNFIHDPTGRECHSAALSHSRLAQPELVRSRSAVTIEPGKHFTLHAIDTLNDVICLKKIPPVPR